jgi:hypothetical protein
LFSSSGSYGPICGERKRVQLEGRGRKEYEGKGKIDKERRKE